jgi:large subunit ribosomal protein L24
MANLYKKNDRVKVIYGKNKGKISKVMKIITRSKQIIIQGVNVIVKNVKPSKASPDGGFIRKEKPIHLSNIMHCTSNSIVSKIGFKKNKGVKKRFYKKSGQFLDNILYD